MLTTGGFLGQARCAVVHIVANDDLKFVVVKPVESSDVLLQCPASGNWHGEEKCFEARVVKALAHGTPRRQHDSFVAIWNCGELFGHDTSLLHAQAAFYYHNVLHQTGQARRTSL